MQARPSKAHIKRSHSKKNVSSGVKKKQLRKLLNHPDLTVRNIVLSIEARAARQHFVKESLGPTSIHSPLSQVLLSSFRQIMSTNLSFIEKLAETIGGWDGSVSVGETFSVFSKHFTIYGHFASAYEKALLTLKSPLFKDFILLQKHADKNSDDNKFEDLLIEPVQRTPRYRMLLEDCLKKTDSKHPDYEKLQVAIELVKQTCASVNEIVRRREDAEKLLDVDDLITSKPKDFTCIAEGRRFLKEAKLMKVRTPGSK